MSKTATFQVLSLQDEKTQKAVSEYVTLGELDRTITTKEDREAWEELWKEFLNSKNWLYAILFIRKYGV